MAFQIGKISMVNPYIGKFVIEHNYGIFGQLKNKLAITHTIAIKLKEKSDAMVVDHVSM